MNHIDGFFSKLKSAFANQANKKEIISEICFEHTKNKLTPEEIEIQGPFVKLKTSPGAKSAIFMKKGAILESLKEKIKPKILDIR